MSKRPHAKGTGVTTPAAGAMIQLLGPGPTFEGMTFSRDEHRNLERVYGFHREPPQDRPPKPVKKELPPNASFTAREDAEREYKEALRQWEKWTDPRRFMQAGANIQLCRHARNDGLRLAAWIARYCEAGEDPLKVLIRMAIEAGFDVDPSDVSWAEDDETSDTDGSEVASEGVA